MRTVSAKKTLLTAASLIVGFVSAVCVTPPSIASTPVQADGRHLIIKYKNAGAFQVQTQEQKSQVIERLNNTNGVNLSTYRSMSGHTSVLQLPQKIPLDELKALSQQLMTDDSIEYAEPDYIKHPFAIPNDPYYASSQWHYQTPATYPGALNLPSAWDITSGDANMVIAVIDTGFRPHPDLESRRVAGYDFISDPTAANDGGGRDNDATDPGDACGGESSWHGTHVAGTIGALSNNNLGVSGVNWNSKIQHIRVLGKCGGSTSDISDAIRWAAGLSVAGVPDNTTPAKVINMSLGGQNTCSITEQNAINDAVAAGAVIVVAAGNNNTDASAFSPASCNNVITVAAVGKNGQRASYSNYGSVIDVAAPGGSDGDLVWSTMNTGTTTPADDSYKGYNGTSMAAPHVTGTVSLMLSVNPTMTPSQIESYLKNSTRAFPVGTIRDCNTSICGTGLVDAYEAVASVSNNVFPTVDAGSDQRVNTNTFVSMTGIGNDPDGTIASYQWTQVSGPAVTLSNANTATASFIAPTVSGVLIFNLKVTDDGGGIANDTLVITVNTPPTANAGTDFAVSPLQTVQLNAGQSYDDTLIATYAWTQISGPTVTLANANTATPFFTAPSTYGASMIFQLTVTDTEGASSSDSVVVSVSAKPIVDAGNDLYFNPNQVVNLSAIASDLDGSISSYQWTQTYGFSVSLSNATTANASFTAPNYGTSYTFKITVTDNNGQTATDTVNVYIVYPPSVGISYASGVNPGAQAVLDGSPSIAQNGASITTYAWTQTGGSAVNMQNQNTAILTFTASNNPGEVLSFKLTITDSNGMSDSATVSVTVNVGPSVTMMPDTYVATNTMMYIQMIAYSSYGTISTSWTQSAGTPVSISDQGPGIALITTPASPTTLIFELHVTDSYTGITTTEEVRVIVGGAPLANAGEDQNVNPSTTVTLDGSTSSDADGNISTYSWTQLSGTNVTLSNANAVSATFIAPNTAGTMVFQLTTTDNNGYTASDKVTIRVNAPPLANAGVDQVVSPNDSVSLDGSASIATVGSISSYLWEQVSGLAVTINNATTATPSFIAPSIGSLVLRLTVTDTNGATSTDDVTIVVTGEIFVNAGPDLVVNPGDPVIITGTATGSSGNITSYNWGQTSGPSVVLSNANSTSASFTAPIASGVLAFQLQVADDMAQTGTDNVNVTVINATPVLSTINNISANAGTAVNFTLNASDANGTTPLLTLTGIPSGATFDANTGVFNWENSKAGNYTLTARAVDAENTIIFAEQSFTITIASAGVLQFEVDSFSVEENAYARIVTVTRNLGTAGTITVDYSSANGSAMAGTDYTAVSGTLTFADGVSSQTFSIFPIDDTTVEGNETFTLSLSNATGYASIGTAISTVTIIEDDIPAAGALSLEASSFDIAENGGSQAITVNRNGGTSGTVSVAYSTSDVSANSGEDYTSASGSLIFADGVSSQTIVIPILDDTNFEGDESLLLTLSNPGGGATLGTSSAILNIIEDDVAPPTTPGTLSFSADQYTTAETDSSVQITVNRTAGSDGSVSVNFSTADITATAGADYNAQNGMISFADGETSQSFTVPIIDDDAFEGNESFSISLSNPTNGATLNNSSAIISINDSEQAPAPQPSTLTLSEPAYRVNENENSITIAVNRLGNSSGNLSVDYQLSDGTATRDSDYTATDGTLTFADGVVSQYFVIYLLNDSNYEGDETINILLNNSSGNTTLGTSQATLTIVEDDAEPAPPAEQNQAPTAPVLIAPDNNATAVDPFLVTFDWYEASDPDGDTITYLLEYCVNADFINCANTPQTKIDNNSNPLLVNLGSIGGSAGISLVLFGLMGSTTRRQGIMRLSGVVLLALIMSACGTNMPIVNGDGTVSQSVQNLQPNTTYYWKVTATDNNNLSTSSEIRQFTTR